jgi:hypothetical protein
VSGESIAAVAAAVVLLTQLAKWAGLPDGKGPLAVVLFSLLGVALKGWSDGAFERSQSFGYFVAWITASASAAGVFGFTRAAADALVKTSSPPTGGGAEPTRKDSIDKPYGVRNLGGE